MANACFRYHFALYSQKEVEILRQGICELSASVLILQKRVEQLWLSQSCEVALNKQLDKANVKCSQRN
jgi:hypothetical protein